VDGRLRIGGPRFTRQLAVGGDDRRRVIDRAGVLAAGAAEPCVRIAVIVGLRRFGLSLAREKRRKEQSCKHSGLLCGAMLANSQLMCASNAPVTTAPRRLTCTKMR